MEFLALLWDIAVHLDKHLAALLAQHGAWVYAVLFLIVFCETGLVVTPFLPGDSLLFIAGALAATGGMDITLLNGALIAAAVLGNSVNYAIGRAIGPKVFQWEDSRFFNRRALQAAHDFYLRHGGKTIVITRFLPILRTFAPFVAGVAEMPRARFQAFNVAGGVFWVVSLTLAGFWFGNLPLVKDNLSAVILAIVVVSVLPAVVGYLRHRAG